MLILFYISLCVFAFLVWVVPFLPQPWKQGLDKTLSDPETKMQRLIWLLANIAVSIAALGVFYFLGKTVIKISEGLT